MMRLSTLQIGLGISVLTHGLVFSLAPLIQIGHRNIGSDANGVESARLEIVFVAEPAEPSPSIVAADVRRLTIDPAAQTAKPADSPVAELVLPQPAEVGSQSPETEPTEDQKVVEALPHSSQENILPAAASPQTDPVPVSSGPDSNNSPRSIAAPPSTALSSAPGSTGPAYLFNPTPRYPAQARARNEQGKVIIAVEVTAEGIPEQMEVRETSGFASLDKAALEAVKSWRFTPARSQNQSINSRVEVPVDFKLMH